MRCGSNPAQARINSVRDDCAETRDCTTVAFDYPSCLNQNTATQCRCWDWQALRMLVARISKVINKKTTCIVIKRASLHMDMFYTGAETLWTAAKVHKRCNCFLLFVYWQFANKLCAYRHLLCCTYVCVCRHRTAVLMWKLTSGEQGRAGLSWSTWKLPGVGSNCMLPQLIPV